MSAVQRLRMVPVAKVADAFGALVLAARLGSDGIVTQLRGGGVDGPYPMGPVEVLVSASDLEVTREILLAEEVESAFADMEEVEVVADLDSAGRRTPAGPLDHPRRGRGPGAVRLRQHGGIPLAGA